MAVKNFKPVSSEEIADEHWIYTFYGTPNARKSFTALTASKNFPEALPASVPAVLDDVIVYLWDQGGMRGLKQMNLKVPHILPLYKYRGDDIFLAAAQAAKATEKILADNPGVEFWGIHDTLSTLNRRLTVHWKRVIEQAAKNKGKEPNKWAFLDAIGESHAKYFDTFTRFDMHNIFLLHARAIPQPEDAKGQAQLRAKGLPGFAQIEMDMTGSGKDQYKTESDIMAPIIFDTNKKESVILPNGGRGYEGRSRLSLPDTVPANIREMLKLAKGEA